jgi:hypothetical protein
VVEGVFATAFRTLNPFRHEVQVHTRFVELPSWMRTFCRFGFQRRRVARREWLLALPYSGFFPQE